ncbi:MAG: GNAT family N-acetyltransferase [Candidatus Dormibacteraceae bacterium]
MNLYGPMIELREYSLRDIEAVSLWSNDPEVTHWMMWDHTDPAKPANFVQAALASARQQPRRAFELVMVERVSGVVVGSARLSVCSWIQRRADIGYVVRRDRWGRGYATETAKLLVDFGFKFGMLEVEAICHPQNHPSIRIMEKAGMCYRGNTEHRRGSQHQKAYLYSVLAPVRAGEEHGALWRRELGRAGDTIKPAMSTSTEGSRVLPS